MYLAHRTEDGREQTLREHLQQTAEYAEAFAAPFGAGRLAYEIGLAHDIGKYSQAFQRRIRGENVSVDHATAGAQEIFKYLGWPGAYCVAGHHGGLPDGGGKTNSAAAPTLMGRLKRQVPPYDAFASEIRLERASFRPPRVLGKGGFTLAFWIRMLYSCLVDADFLDTEAFMRGTPPPRGSDTAMETLWTRLETYITKWDDPETELDRVRNEILRACIAAGENQTPGLFTLTVPTGGGKTVSSLAFALRHARKHGKKRVIYVIPYTSIIEQTADQFMEILGDEPVLEHHSNVDLDGDEGDPERERKKLAAENWDLPVIVTTAVQFFESLFANRPSRCRKLHNLADSVIIFDEAQTLPLPYLLPCVRAIAELAVNYGATCVLCTATQPALGPLFRNIAPDLTLREIVPSLPDRVFRRVRYEKLGRVSEAELARRLNAHNQALCIVSTRKQAQAVYARLEGEGCFHLSTLMYPVRRRQVLAEIRLRLDKGLPCRVVATSLIEAGVDVDFPVVYRAEAGLDSVIQAGGRCNREGNNPADESVVYLFTLDSAEESRLPHALKRPLEVMRAVTADAARPDAPETIERYFTALHLYTGEGMDDKNVVAAFENGAQDPRQPSFPFAETAEKFHLIDQDTRAVLIPCTPEAEALAQRLIRGERSRELLRKAGQYTVNVYENHFNALNAHGALTMLEQNLALLTDLSLYDDQTGLALLTDGGEGIFI